jgi:RNA polymerase sigma factor for flagellar operon FliA
MVDAVDVPAEMQAVAPGAGPGSSSGSGDPAPEELRPGAQELILGCLPLVESIARRVYGALPPNACVELHDLAQSGVLGLVNAGRGYDPGTAVPFSIYARYRIQGEILDSLRRHDLAPRKLRRWQKQVRVARQELIGTLKREPTEEELCDRLMVSAVEMRSRNLALSQTRAPSSSATTTKGDERPDPASGPETGPDHICAQRQLREVLDRLIDSLPARHQQVIRLHYCRQLPMKEIAGALGVHESRVSQMHRSSLQAMGRMLRRYGISSPAYL